jgi:4'-phosphopantetheinyl transferase
VQQVHVWHAELDVGPTIAAKLETLLTSDERGRARGFKFDRDRHRFVAARGMLRAILGGWLGRDPHALQFAAGDHGKPYLADDAVFFNTAHSEDHALFVLADRSPVGVDIEVVRDLPDALDIADRFFTPREAATLREMPEPQRRIAFFQCWTRKEAYVKALGEGLLRPLDSFEVTATADGTFGLELASDHGHVLKGWSLHDLSELPVYSAALAVQAPNVRVRLRRLPLDRLGLDESDSFTRRSTL